MSCLARDVLVGRIQPPGGTIYEEDGWVVDHSISPVALRGWLIVKPRRHVENFGELTDDEAARFGAVSRSAAAACTDEEAAAAAEAIRKAWR